MARDLLFRDTGDGIAAALGTLIAAYPAFRFRHAQVGRHGCPWIADRANALDPGLHTMITADLGELRADRGSHGRR